MIEFIKHLFGFCGAPHPNLWHLLYGTPALGYVKYKIKNKIKTNE